MGIVVGNKKSWIEGHSTDAGIQDQIKANYGDGAKKWAQSLAHAAANQQPISGVWKRLKDNPSNALQKCLGDNFWLA